MLTYTLLTSCSLYILPLKSVPIRDKIKSNCEDIAGDAILILIIRKRPTVENISLRSPDSGKREQGSVQCKSKRAQLDKFKKNVIR